MREKEYYIQVDYSLKRVPGPGGGDAKRESSVQNRFDKNCLKWNLNLDSCII